MATHTWSWWWATLVEPLLRLPVAVLLAAAIGWDRSTRGKPAGRRTHMLVALGTATFTLGAVMAHGSDPKTVARVVQGVAGGLGLLAAGSILQSKGQVSGITTAVSAWLCGAIGVSCGLGSYPVAIVATVAAVIILVLDRVHVRRD